MTDSINHVRLIGTVANAITLCNMANVRFTHIAEGGGKFAHVICRTAVEADRLRQLFPERMA